MRRFIIDLAGPLDQQTKLRKQDRRGQHQGKGGGQHPGLLLQRYLCENATGDGGNPAEKRALLLAAINAATNAHVRQLYNAAFERWRNSLPEMTAANELQTVGRLIVGLGSENVLETGITLHHTYGLPVLPGSALKGLAAHYCDQVWGEQEAKYKKTGEYHKLLFGTTDDSGCIIFHDAWFVPDSEKEPLKLDVMTPHHPKWLDGSAAPTDFDSPTPVPFLSVAGKFHVAVSWHGPSCDNALPWVNMAMECLRDALFHWGIGGKTTSGYGRLADPATCGGPVSASAVPVATQSVDTPRPKYQRGDSIKVTREQVKDKIKFRADDGFVGHFVAPEPPPTEETPTVWIANVSSQGYTFTMKQPKIKAKPSKPDRRGKQK